MRGRVGQGDLWWEGRMAEGARQRLSPALMLTMRLHRVHGHKHRVTLSEDLGLSLLILALRGPALELLC